MEAGDTFYFDFETRSPLDLKKTGRTKYFSHPKTEVTLLSWAVGNGPIQQWAVGESIPPSLIAILTKKELFRKVAHNIIFDFSAMLNFVTQYKIVLDVQWFQRDNHSFVDTMALGEYHRVGDGLDKICTYLNLYTKQIHAKAIMKKQGGPDSKGNYPVELTESEMETFKAYGRHDVEMCRKIHHMLSPLPTNEQRIWEWTFYRNLDGIKVDVDLLNIMKKTLKSDAEKLLPEFKTIVNGEYKLNSPKLKEYFSKVYPYCTNMQKATVDEMIKDTRPAPKEVRRALEIKKMLGSTSTKKVFKAFDIMSKGRIYDTLTYHKAITKRWSGKDETSASGIQIQNFPRSEYKKGDILPTDPSYMAKIRFNHEFGDLDSRWVKNNLRRIWLPDSGYHIFSADYSRIEPVVVFWFSGLGRIPDNWYEQMAAKIFGTTQDKIKKDSYERHIGKFASLSCGYGIGVNGFVKKAKEAGVAVSHELARKCVFGYQTEYPAIVRKWDEYMYYFEQTAITGRTHVTQDGMITFKKTHSNMAGEKDVEITLPSGGKIFYRRVRSEYVRNEHTGTIETSITYLTAHKGRRTLWKGALMEHICSGTAREIMASALLRLREEGLQVLCTVHDELWVQALNVKGIKEEIKKTMEQKPDWAKGLVELKVEIDAGARYLK